MNILPARAALAVNVPQPFGAVGGSGNYSFALVSGAGTIDPVSGLYTAPAVAPSPDDDPIVVEVTDAVTGATDEATVFVGTALDLLCDVIQQGLGLQDGRVRVYNQKLPKPSDDGLFVAVSVLACKAFGNTRSYDPANNAEIQSTNFLAQLSIDIISRSSEALDRKEEVLMALSSTYAEQSQEQNSFKIAQLPTGFVNLSDIDGSAIPYRFNIAVGIQYFVQKISPVAFYDTFQDAAVTTEP